MHSEASMTRTPSGFARFFFSALSCVLMVGCAHATKTEKQEKGETKAEPQRTDDASKAKAPKAPTNDTITTSKTTEQMFKPDGIKKLQQALSSKAKDVPQTGKLDAATQAALVDYQKGAGLPTTGVPDYETLRRLKLKPEDVFHHQTPGERVGVD